MFIVIVSLLAFLLVIWAIWRVSAFTYDMVDVRFGDRLATIGFCAVWALVFALCFALTSEDPGLPAQYLNDLLEGY